MVHTQDHDIRSHPNVHVNSIQDKHYPALSKLEEVFWHGNPPALASLGFHILSPQGVN
jgi:hypothetical protein